MNASLPSGSGLSSPQRWSLLAGGYAFCCATVTAVLLADVLGLFAEVIGLPAVLSIPLLASPALVAGAGFWWMLVERPASYTYPRGAVFGLLTALATGAVWSGRFVAVWGVEMLTAGPVPLLVGFVLGATALAGTLVGLPFAYVRRREETRRDAAATANSL
ncbi:hypothetical protein DQW50_03660 [Halorubrum sp. 48-1-W]|uniref:hypothetical protein n=1 Tax=Halorubrum sp. 48-1-W TaxID=2249761 RepID=UPI000DCD3E94|nr:hypothetical protein [Halorubrum sp. 48-1-W]RAW46501.1 hypothetical protein DQW50_03660 [Halorubrum sp. 48-1-W]